MSVLVGALKLQLSFLRWFTRTVRTHFEGKDLSTTICFKPTLKFFYPCFWKRIFLEASKCGFLLYPIQRRNFDQIIVVRELSKGKKSRPIKVKYKNRKPMSRCCLFWGGSLSPYSPPQNILLCLRYVCRVVKKQCNSFTDMYVLADRLLFIWKMSTTLTLQWL